MSKRGATKKLNKFQQWRIRRQYRNKSLRQLATKYNVSNTTIYKVICEEY